MAVFREAMGLLSLAGLPVASLRFPVNAKLPLAAALLRTVCLAPPAPAADKEPHAAEAAMNLDKKQRGLQPCIQSEAVVERMNCLGLPIVSGALFQSPKLPLRAFFFIPSNIRKNRQKKDPSWGRARCGSKRRAVLSVDQSREQPGHSPWAAHSRPGGSRIVIAFTCGSFFLSKVGQFL